MSRIPDQLPLALVEGATTPVIAPAPTDFGFDQAGGDMERVAVSSRRVQLAQIRLQAQQDKQAVAPTVAKLEAANTQGFTTDAASLKPGDTGFVDAQSSAANTRAYLIKTQLAQQGATPGQLAEFDSAARQQTLGVTQAAATHAAKVNAAPIIQAQANLTNSQISGATTAFNQAVAKPEQDLYLAHADGDTDLPQKVGALYDGQIAQAQASTSPALWPDVQSELQTEKVKAQAAALEFQTTHAQLGVAKGANDQVAALTNTVVGAPSNYANATTLLPKIVAALPVSLQPEAQRQGMAGLATARIKGLIQANQGAQALTELNAGTYDAFLKPDDKEGLVAEAEAQNRATGPQAVAQATATISAREAMQGDIAATAATGKGFLDPKTVDADYAAGVISAGDVAEYNDNKRKAQEIFASSGAVGAMTNAQLSAAAAAQPSPEDFAQGGVAFGARQKAVQTEIAARQQPGTWAFTNTTQQLGGQQLGPAMQAKWQAAVTPAPDEGPKMMDYASTMARVQYQAGIDKGAMQAVPQSIASGLARSVTDVADPKARVAGMEGIARLAGIMPTAVTMGDGTVINPRAIFVRQLAGAGLTPVESATIADFGADPAKMGRVAAALNDSTLKTPLPGKGEQAQLQAAVRANLAPFLASSAGDADAAALAQGRIDRTTLVARELIASQHMSVGDAAKAAASDVTGGYRFVDGWRMPAQLANQPAGPSPWLVGPMFSTDALGMARRGASQTAQALTANGGAGLYAPPTIAGDLAHRQAIHASQIDRSGSWKTLPDDSGLALVVPSPDGRYVTAQDRFGRPVQMTWAQLQAVGGGAPSPFAAPPPNAVTTPAGQPVRAFSKTEGFGALSWSVEYQESHLVNGQVSPAGALGMMQVMPGTGAKYAAQLHLPWDAERARTDRDYNEQIGRAALGDLTNRYMTGANPAAGLGLALAGYNAGEGHLNGFTDKTGRYHAGWLQTIGDPRTGQISLNDWVQRIPIPETRNYVEQVLGRAVTRLHGGGQ